MTRLSDTSLIRKSSRLFAVIFFGMAIVSAYGADSRHGKNGDQLASTGSMQDTQVGKASWYGGRDIGRLTASGECYHRRDITAAHRQLPFNTRVLVTNLRNGRQVVVRINDRGPYIKGRIIDLSFEAAKSIGMVKSGVTSVHLRVL
ncbi:MAG: septal ring lytic transglycosylase RlpA family lipoprotein [Verrucomicrobia bacterium]|nr:MAG: septal ring lytic transglycosylase RlpA family lipoprotein [Verrucomicrobiota bacterium]